MNILVTGANGQLGNEMRVLSAENQQHTYFFTDVQELDICDEQAIRAFVTDNRVDVIGTVPLIRQWTRQKTIPNFAIN